MKFKVARFAVVGILATAVDLVIYSLSLYFSDSNYWLAKSLGFLAGTVFGFLINRSWTFSDKGHFMKSISKYIALYSGTLLINVTANSLVILSLGSSFLGKSIAFLSATALSATINYIVMKRFIFTDAK